MSDPGLSDTLPTTTESDAALELSCCGKPAGRPRAADMEARMENLLHTAGCLFLEKGYGKVSLEMIAREAHVAVRTIYVKFGGKAGLFDDHFQDLKRIIGAVAGKARRITVIMPFLYEGRQYKRTGRESLDCALALQELTKMGVDNIITFDAHDHRVQNAIPLKGFETVQPIYQFVKALLSAQKDIVVDANHMMVISPDEGGMNRAIYFANMLGLDIGMFYKRRDYTKVVDGQNPIIAHEFLGGDVEGKDLIVVDDMISSGESCLDVAKELKARKARRVYICATFGLFTGGLAKFDKYYELGIIDGLLTTNLVYQTPQLLSKPYYIDVDISKYIALIIDRLNHDSSISELMLPAGRINTLLKKHRDGENE